MREMVHVKHMALGVFHFPTRDARNVSLSPYLLEKDNSAREIVMTADIWPYLVLEKQQGVVRTVANWRPPASVKGGQLLAAPA